MSCEANGEEFSYAKLFSIHPSVMTRNNIHVQTEHNQHNHNCLCDRFIYNIWCAETVAVDMRQHAFPAPRHPEFDSPNS